MPVRVLVTPRSLTEKPHPAVEALRGKGVELVYASPGKMPGEAELLRLVPGITGWIAGVEPISEKVIATAAHLRCISRNGVGIDNLPLDVLEHRGIAVCITNGANAQGVAELAIAMIFASLRHLSATDHGIKAGGWPRHKGSEMKGRKLGVVGCGAVGREVARIGAAIGAHVLAYDPMQPALPLTSDQVTWVSLADLFRQSDIVTLHCPAPADGKPLVDAAVLASVKPGLILINTARAALVNEPDLIAALDAGRVASYCTDVFDPEPPILPGLASRSDVIATSHIGGYTEESVDRATAFAVANLVAALGLD